jgi:Fe-S-cluster containining protein
MKDSDSGQEKMECLRCGICCTRHQAFVTAEDIERITASLGITVDEWERQYDDSRWRYSEYNLIRHVNGGCAFLTYKDGVAACAIHPVKPECCRNWAPGPGRRECREGLEQAKKPGTTLPER